MRRKAQLNDNDLKEMIENVEKGGGDASELRRLQEEKAELEREIAAESKPKPKVPVKRQERRAEEPTTEERLEAEVGDLFPGGIGVVLAEVIEFDRNHTLVEIKKMCVEAGLSPSGHKKGMAAKLIARGIKG